MAGLADRLASVGYRVFVPEWDSRTAVGGRNDLTASLNHARTEAGSALALIGWSLGGKAAITLGMGMADLNWLPAAVIGLAPATITAEPPFGESPYAQSPRPPNRVPFTIIHGSQDEVVPVRESRRFHQRATTHGWNVTLRETSASHASIIGCAYDPDTHHCVHDPAAGPLLDYTCELIDSAMKSACPETNRREPAGPTREGTHQDRSPSRLWKRSWVVAWA